MASSLEAAVGGQPYLAGDAFSAADLYVGAHLSWGMGFGLLEKRPAFEAYVARLVARPDALSASAIDDALLEEAGAPKPPA